MRTFKWSVRHMDYEAVERLREVQETSGGLLGELVSEAIMDWFENLPEEEESVQALPASLGSASGPDSMSGGHGNGN